MSKIEKIIDQLSELTIIQASELVTGLKKKWGVTTAMIPSKLLNDGKTGTRKEEENSYSVILTDIGRERIKVIKAIKEITNLGLKESKNKVESVNSNPVIVKDKIDKELAEKIKNKLIASGAKAEIK